MVGTRSFTNATATTVPALGLGVPYPSALNVSGMGGVISTVTVELRSISHTYPADMDVLLVGPNGQKAMILSDVGGSTVISGVTVTLTDAASTSLTAGGRILTGTYKPSDVEPGEKGDLDTFTAPAPAGPYTSALSVFNGQGANGAWSLYVVDDGPGDQGSIGSWSLTITTVAGGPQAPTISDLSDQTTTVNTATPALGFTVNDGDTPVTSLTVSGSSSNPTLVPNGNIVFGGSGSSRTVTVTPASGQSGSATITVTVSDGALSASDSFVLTVNAVNTAPTISDVADQNMNEDGSTGGLSFTVGDGQTAAGSLTVSGSSSNPTLVPNGNIVFGGSGSSRTVTITPAANQSGAATIILTVSDGTLTASDAVVVTVNAVNDPPTISNIADQSTGLGTPAGPLSFTVGDVETAAGSLTVSGSSSDPTLVPNGNIVFGGSGSSRTVTVTPAAGESGTATITVSVSDGALTATDTFVLTASSLFIGTRSFTNTTAIVIPTQGAATPYPSTINVTGMGGSISSVSLTLNALTHTNPDDLDALLVGPGGAKLLVLSDAGGGGNVANVTLTFSDSASGTLPNSSQIAAGTFRPSNYGGGDTFPTPAPAAPFALTLATFNGQTPNGAWTLYVVDDSSSDSGQFGGGWILTLTTTVVAPAGADGLEEPSSAVPPARLSILPRAGAPGVILRVDGEPGEKYTVDASMDLREWTVVGVVSSEDGISYREDGETDGKSRLQRFYRVWSNP